MDRNMKRTIVARFVLFCLLVSGFGWESLSQPATSYEAAERWGASLLASLEKENVAHPMQYVVLQEGRSFKSQVVQPYTIYEVRSPFDLGGEQIQLPAHCILAFNGGRIRNGGLVAADTRFCARSSQAATFNCDTVGVFEKIEYIVKASEAGLSQSASRGTANYTALQAVVRQGVNLYLDGTYPVTFSSPIVLSRVFQVFGGSLVFEKNAFRFSDGGGLVVDGSSIVASSKSKSALFCGSSDLQGAVTIKKLAFVQSTIDCAYLANVLYKDLNSDKVSFGIRWVEMDHCVLKQTGRVRILDAVIAERCSFTNNYFQNFVTTPIYVACQHSVEGSPNDSSAYKYVKENLTKGCPVIIDRNIFIGTPVSLNFYYCSALIKSEDCSFTNNYVRDIINYSEGKNNSLATAYDAYLSCTRVLYEGNFVKDVMSYTRKGGTKPKSQVGKSKTNPLSLAGVEAERLYRRNCFLVDGDRFLKMGADASSLHSDIFGNVSYIDRYEWVENTLIFKKAQIKTGVSTRSYRTFLFEDNYFEAQAMTGNGIITTRSQEPMDWIRIRNNTFKLGDSQLFPVLNQRYNEKYSRSAQKEITITGNTFINCAPKIFYHTGEQITVKDNISGKGDIPGNLYLSKFSGSGTILDVRKMDSQLKYVQDQKNAGGLFQYFSSLSKGRYSIELDAVPPNGVNYYYIMDGDQDFTIEMTLRSGKTVRVPFHYKKGQLSYDWEGRRISVAGGKSASQVWYEGNGFQMRSSFYASNKQQVLTQLRPSNSSRGGEVVKFTFIAE